MQEYIPENIIFCKSNEISTYVRNFNKVVLVGNRVFSNTFSDNTISIPDGEEAKSMDVVKILWDMFSKLNIDRHSLVVSVGGGSVSDVVGFAVSTYMRGIPLCSVPTTLVAMIDASIGGKRAINYNNYKNLIGNFYPAEAIFIDLDNLGTLDEIELKSGYAEAIKISLVCDFELSDNTQELIKDCIENKQKIVLSDYRDISNKRSVLNYGHTFAHAFESCEDFNVPHGIAVALGMDFIAKNYSSISVIDRQNNLFDKFGIFEEISKFKKNTDDAFVASVINFLNKDKKIDGEDLSLVVLEEIGKPKQLSIKVSELKYKLLNYFSSKGE